MPAATAPASRGVRNLPEGWSFDDLVGAGEDGDGVTGAYDRNMLMVLGPHTARGNITQAISHSVEFQADMLRFMQRHNYTRVETRPEKVDEWTRIGEALLSFKVDSWQNGVNRNVAGRTVRRVLGYNGNGAHFRRTTDEVAKGGYQEFTFR